MVGGVFNFYDFVLIQLDGDLANKGERAVVYMDLPTNRSGYNTKST